MKPLNIVTDALTLPARTAGHVAAATLGATVGAATVGLRATGRAVGRALDRATGTPHPAASPWPTDTTTVVAPTPASPVPASPEPPVGAGRTTTPPVKDTPSARLPAKAATRKAPAKKRAPSKKAAVLAPALGVPETDVLDGTADLDPS